MSPTDPEQELLDLLRSIPGVHRKLRHLHSLGKGPRQPTWYTDDPALMTLLVYSAGLVEMIGELAERVEAMRGHLDDIAAKAAVVHAAELAWQAKVALPDAIVFGNSAGEVATLPLGFVRVYAARRCLDATEIVEESGEIIVKDGEDALARVPKSLWVCLDRVLDACPFLEAGR